MSILPPEGKSEKADSERQGYRAGVQACVEKVKEMAADYKRNRDEAYEAVPTCDAVGDNEIREGAALAIITELASITDSAAGNKPNTDCSICHTSYYTDSGCDPCPKCGANYGTQVWWDEKMVKPTTDTAASPAQEQQLERAVVDAAKEYRLAHREYDSSNAACNRLDVSRRELERATDSLIDTRARIGVGEGEGEINVGQS